MDKSNLAVSTYNKIAKLYTNQYFDDVTDIPYIDKFISYLPQNARVLDVGSGPGQFTLYLLNKGFTVEGIDMSEEMVNIAKKRVFNGKFQVMDMRNLQYPQQSFDGLLVAYSLIHVPSEQINDTLLGFNKALKTGGYIEIIAQQGEADKIIDEPLKKDEKMFINFFTKDILNTALSEARFEVLFQEEPLSQDPDGLSDRIIYTIAKKQD